MYLFFYPSLLLSSSLDKPWSQVSFFPSPSPVQTCLHFYVCIAQRVRSAFPLLVDFRRMLLTHALSRAFRESIFMQEKSPYSYVHTSLCTR